MKNLLVQWDNHLSSNWWNCTCPNLYACCYDMCWYVWHRVYVYWNYI